MSEPRIPVITIDGPSGSGKGTVARLLASALGWHFLDSGALYRAVGLRVVRAAAISSPHEVWTEHAQAASIQFVEQGAAEPLIYLDGEEVSQALRDEQAGAAASKVAAVPAVRAALLEKQRSYQRAPGLVADGRDMGTVVFPDAELKVFLIASVNERARRRYKQLMEKGIRANLADLSQDLQVRDERDTNRAIAPLRPAADAVELDSTNLAVEEVVAAVLMQARSRSLESC